MRHLLWTALFAATILGSSGDAFAQNRPGNGDGRGRNPSGRQEDGKGGQRQGERQGDRQGERQGQRVNIQIMVVHATDSENGIDSRLQSLASSFRYFKYKGYRLLTSQRTEIGVGDDAGFSVEGGRRLKVTLISKDESRARVRLEMSNANDGKLLDTTVSINRDGTFIVAGPKYKDGILMLPLRASY